MWASKMYILHSMGPLNHQNRTFGGKLIFDIQLKYGRGNFSKIQLFFFGFYTSKCMFDQIPTMIFKKIQNLWSFPFHEIKAKFLFW